MSGTRDFVTLFSLLLCVGSLPRRKGGGEGPWDVGSDVGSDVEGRSEGDRRFAAWETSRMAGCEDGGSLGPWGD